MAHVKCHPTPMVRYRVMTLCLLKKHFTVRIRILDLICWIEMKLSRNVCIRKVMVHLECHQNPPLRYFGYGPLLI